MTNINLEDMAERMHAKALLDAYQDAVDMRDALDDSGPAPDLSDEDHERVNALTIEYHARIKAAREWFDAEKAKISGVNALMSDAADAMDRALEAYEALPRRLAEDDCCRALICAKSGAPIWDDEDLLEGDGDVVIRALVLDPPTPDQVIDIEEYAA